MKGALIGAADKVNRNLFGELLHHYWDTFL